MQQAHMSAESVLARVSATITAVMGATVADSAPLMDSGLDSLGAVELRNTLSEAFALDLPATLTFDYPSANAIAGFIISTFASATDLPQHDGVLATLPPSFVDDDTPSTVIALTGLSFR